MKKFKLFSIGALSSVFACVMIACVIIGCAVGFTPAALTENGSYESQARYGAVQVNDEITAGRNTQNVAFKKPVTSTSDYNATYVASKVTDGDKFNDVGRWNSKATKGEEILTIDLGKNYNISEIHTYFWAVNNMGKEMAIQLAADGGAFSEVDRFTNSQSITEKSYFMTPIVARYVKLIMFNAYDNWGYSVREIEVFEPNEHGAKNLAIGQPVTSSSNYSAAYSAKNVLDGDKTSDAGRWNSQKSQTEEWITVDLGKEYYVAKVALSFWHWNNMGTNLSIQTSTNGTAFTEVKNYSGNVKQNTTAYLSTAVKARYVKIVMNNCNTEWGYSIKELEVFESENVAFGKTVISSSDHSAPYVGQKVTDGDLIGDPGRWNSAANNGEEWVQIDLGKVYNVTQIIAEFWSGNNMGQSFTLLVSKDGSSFSPVTYTFDGAVSYTATLDTSVEARYVKAVCNQCNTAWGYSIREIEVYSPDVLQGSNVALNKNVYVSENFKGEHEEVDIEPYYATDGSLTTRWSSEIHHDLPIGAPVESWMMIDLEEQYELSEVVIRWYYEITYATDFTVQVSNDGVGFTDAMVVKATDYFRYHKITLPDNVKGRYVKLAFHVQSHENGYSMYEVAVYGSKTGNYGTAIVPGEAELAIYTDSMKIEEHAEASGGYYATGLDAKSTVSFLGAPSAYGVKVRYTAATDGEMTMFINGASAKTFAITATEANKFGEADAEISIPANATVMFKTSVAMGLDCVSWMPKSYFCDHVFDQQIASDDYLAKTATCTNKATYYYSCGECGAAGDDTFESGEMLEHVYNVKNASVDTLALGDACSTTASYYYTCVCGKMGDETYIYGAAVTEHVFNKKVESDEYLDSAANCSKPSTYFYSCVCGESGTEVFEVGTVDGTHDYINVVNILNLKAAANCQHADIYYKTCSRCGVKSEETFENGDLGPCEYALKVVSSATAAEGATCTSAAKYYYTCECDLISDSKTFAYGNPLPHSYVIENATVETLANGLLCQGGAEFYYTCECGAMGDETFTVADPISEHEYVMKVVDAEYKVSDATCTSAATYNYSCACGKEGDETFTYGKLAKHVYGTKITDLDHRVSKATCTSPAVYYLSCDECGATGNANQVYTVGSPSAHTYDNEVVSSKLLATYATCTKKATYYMTCDCGAVGEETFEYGEPTTHSYVIKNATEKTLATPATCVNKATYYYTCVCGAPGIDTFEYGETEAHVYDKKVTSASYFVSGATCEKAETYFYSCECGKKGTETFAYGEPRAHVYDNKVAREEYLASPATCTEKATYYVTCDCGAVGEETFERGDLLKHKYIVKNATEDTLATKATCVNKATYYYTCSCGAMGNDTFSYGEVKAHSYDDGVVTGKPTTEKEGVKTFTCGDCGKAKTEPVAKLESDGTEEDDAKSCATVAPVNSNPTGGMALMLLTLAGIAAVLFTAKRKARR